MKNHNEKSFDNIKLTNQKKNEPVVQLVENVPKAPDLIEDTFVSPAETKTKFKKRHKRIFIGLTVFFILLFITTLLAGAAFAEEKMYQNKIFPGVEVWGMPVGGKTVEQVEALLAGKIESYKVQLDGPDQDYNASADDLGLIFNTESIALSAYSRGRSSSFVDNYLTRARLVLLKINWQPLQKFIRANDLALPISPTIDEEKFNAYIDSIATNIAIKPQDSQVSVKGASLDIVPAVYGREVAKEDFKKELLGEVSSLKNRKIIIKTNEIKPNVVDKAAEEVRVQTENVISRPVILSYNGQEFRPNKETIASWITFSKDANATNYTLNIDTNKMNNYFSYIESKINIYPVNKKVRVENGVKETVIQEGKDGTLLDRNLLGRQIAQILPVQAQVVLTIPTYVAKFKTETEQVIVADWDKYIDINISTQTMTAYLKGGQAVGSWAVTTGNRYHPTPIGTWLITGKSAVTRMTGGTPGVDYYDLPNVHWVSWFKGGGYSIHEAYWRSSFGGQDYLWNGSHGCVNSPIDVAHFIYDWAPVGTPVIVHY